MSLKVGTLPSPVNTSSDPFLKATEFTNSTSTFVQDQLAAIQAVVGINNEGGFTGAGAYELVRSAIEALEDLSDTIHALPGWDLSTPLLDPTTDVEIDLPSIPFEDFGKIDDFNVGNDVDITGLPSVGTVTVPGFSPTPFSLTIPAPPVPENITKPGTAPANPGFTYPDAPTVTLPDAPQLQAVQIPAFTSPVIPSFSPTYPEFSERDISTLLDWTEPTYTEEVIDEVKTQISVFFAGGSGIDPDIEESIFARARDREDRTIQQQIQAATEEWANKGYTAPPGMLAKRIDNIRDEGTLKKLGLNREFAIKVHNDEIENLRFAVQQGISAEQLYVQLFLARVERLFEAQKLSIQWQVDLYGLAIQVYQMQMEEVRIRSQVYEVQVRAALVEIEVFKALVEGEKAKAEVNKALVDAYVAEIGAREALVRMYSEQVRAVGVQAQVFETEVQAFRNTVEAYAAEVGADRNRFEAYAAQIRGEGLKADIRTAEAQAYQAQIGGIEAGVRAEVAALEGAVSAVELEIRNYEATVRGLVGRAQAQLGQIQANVAGNQANTSRFVAKTGAEEAVARVDLASWEGKNRTDLEQFRTDAVAFQARLERAVKEIELLASTQAQAGQLASTIAAGGLASLHVSAQLGADSRVAAAGNFSYSAEQRQSIACNTQNQSSVTYEAESFGETGVPCPSFTAEGNPSVLDPTVIFGG